MKQILERIGIEQLSEMQQAVLAESQDKASDLILLSPTGTGKTLAYLLSALKYINKETAEIQVVVITPSRELALQSNDFLMQMNTTFKSLCFIGGHAANDALRIYQQKHPQIVFVTPGRLNFYIENHLINCSEIKLLIIDEFDKCLDLGFQEEMKAIHSKLPKQIKTWLISATNAPSDFEEYVSPTNTKTLNYLTNQEDNRLKTFVVKSPKKDKLNTLKDLLLTFNGEPTMVFVNYRESVERVYNFLKKEFFYAEKYHGGMEQKNRERSLYKFKSGGSNILISTDLAARGLDITDTKHIIHYHLPLDEAAFQHRNGRSTRWENNGSSYVILGPEEILPNYLSIENMHQLELPVSNARPIVPSWITLYIGRGKKEKLSKGDILGFICKKGKLKGTDIGRIDVEPHCSYVAIKRNKLKILQQNISGEKIKDMKTIIEPMH